MLCIPRSNEIISKAISLGIPGGKIHNVPRWVTNTVFNKDSWKFSEENNYNPNLIAYKPQQYITSSEKVLSINWI